MESQAAVWDEATDSTTKVESLEKSFSMNQEEFDLCTANISVWKDQIKELQAKILKAKEHQDEPKKLDRKELDREIKVASTMSKGPKNWVLKLLPLLSTSP